MSTSAAMAKQYWVCVEVRGIFEDLRGHGNSDVNSGSAAVRRGSHLCSEEKKRL